MTLLGIALLRLQRSALRRPWLALALAAGLAIALGSQVPRAQTSLSARDMADPSLPWALRTAQMEATFGEEHALLVVFHPATPGGSFTPGELRALRAWVERERARTAEVLRVASPFDVPHPGSSGEDGRPRPLVDGDDPAALRLLLGTPWEGVLTDREARDVAVQVVFPGGRASRWFGSFDPAPVAALERRARELLVQHPGIQVRLAGSAAYDRFALDGVARFRVLNLVVLAGLVLLMRLLFGTWRAGLLLCLVLLWSAGAVFGGMAVARVPVDLLSVGLFLLLAVTVVEDFLFIAHERLASDSSWRRPFRTLLLPGFLTSLTTVVGFGSLCVAETATVRRLGAWGGLGAALEWVATFLVLPALLARVPRLRGFVARERAAAPSLLALAGVAGRGGRRLPPAAAWALLALLPAAGAAATLIDFNDTPLAMFPSDHPGREGPEYLRRTRGWVGQISVVFPPEATPEQVAGVANALRRDPAVATVLDPWSALAFTAGGDTFRMLELAADPAAAGPVAAEFRGPGGRLRAAVFVREADIATLRGLCDRVLALFPGGDGFPAGDLVAYAEFGETVPRTLAGSLLTCIGLVSALLVALCRALGLGWGVRPLLASLWGPAAVLAAVALLRVPVNYLTCAFASVLVGLAGDNAVQFACAASRGSLAAGITRRRGAAVLVTFVTAAAALVFLGSLFVPPRHLGVLLAAGLLAALFGDVWVLSALLRPAPAPAPPEAGP